MPTDVARGPGVAILAKMAVVRRAIESCRSVRRAVHTLRAIIVADAYSQRLSPRFAAGRVLTKSHTGPLSPGRTRIVYSLRNLDLTKQILALLERTRPTSDLTASYASARQTLKIQGRATASSPLSASHRGHPDASRRSQQSMTIHTLLGLRPLRHRLLLLKHDHPIVPVAAGYSFIEHIVPAPRGGSALRTLVRPQIPSFWRTPHSESIRASLPGIRAPRPTSVTASAGDNFQRRQNRWNAATKLGPLRSVLSYYNAALLLDAAAATLKRAAARARSVLRGTESARTELRLFRRSAPALRTEKAQPLETAWAPGSFLKALAPRNAAMAGALATALMPGNANGILTHPARATASAPRTAAVLSEARKARPSIAINYSPHFTLRSPEAGDSEAIRRRVMEVLERHGRELRQILARELVRYQRTEF
jgi:hypothetical protein